MHATHLPTVGKAEREGEKMTTLKPCPVLELSPLYATVTERCCTCQNRVPLDLEPLVREVIETDKFNPRKTDGLIAAVNVIRKYQARVNGGGK